ncbi:MAG TPA: HAD-IIA family hydrolase [Actinomycetota bacterium]|nr:HAD-IIA family hydrolase [Actinomycetota bacterium]
MNPILDSYRAFAIDLDGVVWRGSRFIEGAPEALKVLIASGHPLLLLTNNASYPASEVIARLADAGLHLEPHNVLNTATVARSWIELNGMTGKRAMILAAPSVLPQLDGCIEAVEATRLSRAELVLVGRDVTFDFAKLDAASAAVRDGAVLLAMNRDTEMPVDDEIQPGTGAIVAAIEAAAGAEAIVLGKPELPMMQAAAEILGDHKTLMIGDRIESDIVGAHRIGWDAALVLSGVSSGSEDGEQPEFVAPTLADLVSG